MDLEKMTEAELEQKGQQYSEGFHEGGEGFNPYYAELQRREFAKSDTDPLSQRELERMLKGMGMGRGMRNR